MTEPAIPRCSSPRVAHRHMDVEGVDVFFREAGPEQAPAVVLLHGFPSSSRMYGPLLRALSDRYRVIAPDYPGFGHSEAPALDRYPFTFDALACTVAGLLSRLGIASYVLFMQDYGGPVGFRLADREPSALRGIVVQNANAYVEGLGPKWTAIAGYWSDRSSHSGQVDSFLSLEAARQRHVGTSPNAQFYDPDTWTDEFAHLSRPGQREIQAELLYDYRSNVAAYPRWQALLRKHQPPALVLWGRYDPSFVVAGAFAYRRDLPRAEVHILDAGHFALDEQDHQVVALTRAFLDRLPAPSPATAGGPAATGSGRTRSALQHGSDRTGNECHD